MFEDTPGITTSLPTHLAPRFKDPKMDGSLRDHFHFALRIHLCGGDIWKQYNVCEVKALMDGLGFFDHKGDGPKIELSDKVWRTEIGEVILEDHLAQKMEDGVNT